MSDECRVICLNNFIQFDFIEAERFFNEDMFASFEGRDDLVSMEVVTGGNDYCINIGIIKYLVLIGGRKPKTELTSNVLSTDSCGRTDTSEFDARNLLHCWKQSPFCKLTSTEQTDSHRLMADG